MRRRGLIAGIVVSGLLTPLSGLPALILLNGVNPMQLAFVSSIRVANRSGRSVDVIPVGTFNSGRKGWVPTLVRGFPAIPRLGPAWLRIPAGGDREILFNWDDICFSELVVRDESGECRQLVTEPDPPKKDYHALRWRDFTILEWSGLDPVDPSVLAAANARPNLLQRLSWWTLLGFCVPPFFLFAFTWALARDNRRRRRGAERQGIGTPP